MCVDYEQEMNPTFTASLFLISLPQSNFEKRIFSQESCILTISIAIPKVSELIFGYGGGSVVHKF